MTRSLEIQAGFLAACLQEELLGGDINRRVVSELQERLASILPPGQILASGKRCRALEEKIDLLDAIATAALRGESRPVHAALLEHLGGPQARPC